MHHRHAVVGMAVLMGAEALSAQPVAERSGPVFGVAIGVARLSLSALDGLPAVRGRDVAIGWHVGWQTSSRLAVLVAATSSAYRYPGGGRPRRRAFETITPTLEYRVHDGVRLQAGAGLQLDAPVFWDVRSAPAERRFSRGVGMVLGASVAPTGRARLQPELRVRWNGGSAAVPEGRLHGQTAAVLIGVRHGPPREP